MPKDKHARQTANAALIAWANLVGTMVETLRDEHVGNDVIKRFLDALDAANLKTLDMETSAFAVHVTAIFRQMLPSND